MAPRVAAGLLGRPRGGARGLLRVSGRMAVGAHRSGGGRSPARVPERVQAPRQLPLPGFRNGPQGPALPVPSLDVGPLRPPERGSRSPRLRSGAYQRGLLPAPRAGGHLGADGVRQFRSRGTGTGRVPRGYSGGVGVGRTRRLPVCGGHPYPGRQQLEGRHRGLLGDLPRAGHPRRDARVDRRRARPPAAVGIAQRLLPELRGRQPQDPRLHRPVGVGVVRGHPGQPDGVRT